MNLRFYLILLILFCFSASSYAQEKKAIKSLSSPKVKLDKNVVIDECNNKPLPDIVLTGVEVSNVSSWTSGAVMTVNISLRNAGQCKTGNFNIRVKRFVDRGSNTNEHDWKYFRVQPLEPFNGRNSNNSDAIIKYEFVTHPANNVQYRFSVDADPENRVNEFIENNNSLDRVGEFVFKHKN